MQNKQNAAMPHSHWIKDKRLCWISQFYYILHEKIQLSLNVLFSQCASSQFEMFPTSVFQVLLSSYKTAQNPIVPSEKRKQKQVWCHTHTHTHSHLQYKHVLLMELKGFRVTISYPKLNDWRIYCGFIVLSDVILCHIQCSKPNSRNHVRMRSFDINTNI